jgi:3-dehydroquinate synthetase
VERVVKLNFEDNRLQVRAVQEISYPIILSENIFDPQNELLLTGGRVREGRRFVVIDDFIYKLHCEAIETYFEHRRITAKIVALPGGESNKSITGFLKLFQELDDFPLDRRRDPLIVIGGGTLTDLAGLVAGTFRRGTPHLKVPTTLLGYVDAAVGIKTGIHFGRGLNRMGSYELPVAVILDKTFLHTLSRRQIVNGLAEMVKLAVIKDIWLFEGLERFGAEGVKSKFQNQSGQALLNRAIAGMVAELQPNFHEIELERSLDFGHTFSPALEADAAGALLHGEAVAIDIAFSIVLANRLALLSDPALERILRLIYRLNLPYYHHLLQPSRLWEGLLERKRHRDGFQRVPLPTAVGTCLFHNHLTYDDIAEACLALERIYQNNREAGADQRESVG